MFVDNRGLHLDDRELRSFLVLVVGFLNWECTHTCIECCFHVNNETCVVSSVRDEFDELFKGLVI